MESETEASMRVLSWQECGPTDQEGVKGSRSQGKDEPMDFPRSIWHSFQDHPPWWVGYGSPLSLWWTLYTMLLWLPHTSGLLARTWVPRRFPWHSTQHSERDGLGARHLPEPGQRPQRYPHSSWHKRGEAKRILCIGGVHHSVDFLTYSLIYY